MHLPHFVKATVNDDFLSNNSTARPFINLITRNHYYETLYSPLLDMNRFGWILLDTVAKIWLGVECLFYLYYVVTHNRMQTRQKAKRPLTKQQRIQSYYQCFDAIEDLETWCVGWYFIRHDLSHPSFGQIRRGNIAMWFCWAYWDDDIDQVVATEEGAKQLEWMIDTLEEKYNVTFPVGRNDDIHCIRTTVDPVQAVHRPFLFYLYVYLNVSILNSLVFTRWWKFQSYGDQNTLWGGPILKLHQGIHWLWSTLSSQQKLGSTKATSILSATITSSASLAASISTLSFRKTNGDGEDDQLVYWYRPASTPYQQQQQQQHETTDNLSSNHIIQPRQNDGNTRTPLVFLHGFGVGPGFYTEFISHLVKINRPLYVVEMPSVSMRLVEKVPDSEDVVIGIKNMLHSHGHKHAVFIGHSFGTTVMTWIMNSSPSLIAGIVMIDPVCFLLQHAHIAYNFNHKPPKGLFDYVMRYGASRELFISNYVARHFQWFESICFIDKTYSKQHPLFHNAIVFLSEKDGVSDTPLVAKHFVKHGVNHRIMQNLEHGQFLMTRYWRKQIMDQVNWIARNVDDEGIDLRP